MAGGSWKIRLVIMAIVAAVGVFSYFGKTSINPITGEKQRVSLTQEQEIALGVQSAPELVAQLGGLDPDPQAQALVKRVGQRIVASSAASRSGYPFAFHLLADPETVNAFALPGGHIFITRALFAQLDEESELAGVLAHEVGHVLARHSAQRLAKQELTRTLTGAVAVGAGSFEAAQVAAVVGNLVNMKYGRGDELDADRLGVCLMRPAGYDPAALVGVMKVLARASGGSQRPEFASTHPAPANRVDHINEYLEDIDGACSFEAKA